MLNIHRTIWAKDYEKATYPFYDRVFEVTYRTTASPVECSHGEEIREGIQVEFLPNEEEAAVLARGGVVSLFLPGLKTPPEIHAGVIGDAALRRRVENMPGPCIAQTMYETQPVKPPTEWADLMPAERQVWIDRADMAIAMVFQEFGESPFDAEPLDAN